MPPHSPVAPLEEEEEVAGSAVHAAQGLAALQKGLTNVGRATHNVCEVVVELCPQLELLCDFAPNPLNDGEVQLCILCGYGARLHCLCCCLGGQAEVLDLEGECSFFFSSLSLVQ